MDNLPADMMTIEEVAEFLRIPVSSVYKLAQEGRLPAQKIGRHWRFYRPSLMSWIRSGGASAEGKRGKDDTTANFD